MLVGQNMRSTAIVASVRVNATRKCCLPFAFCPAAAAAAAAACLMLVVVATAAAAAVVVRKSGCRDICRGPRSVQLRSRRCD